MNTMPFGKFQDRPIEEVPTSYLKWALENCTRMCSTNRQLLEAELKSRGEHPPERSKFRSRNAGTGLVTDTHYVHTWGEKGGQAVRAALQAAYHKLMERFEGFLDDAGYPPRAVIMDALDIIWDMLNVPGELNHQADGPPSEDD